MTVVTGSTVGTRPAATAAAPVMPALVPAATAAHQVVSRERQLMGGRVGVHVLPGAALPWRAVRDADRVLARLGAWSARLTRFDAASDLSRLNADGRDAVRIRPTLAAVLDWGRAAEASTDALVNIALLEARLAAEDGDILTGPAVEPGVVAPAGRVPAAGAWSMDRGARATSVRRPPGLRFDLDGVAKGWLADRALVLLDRYPAAVVDADGDVAIRLERGETWWVGIADPRRPDFDLLVLRLAGDSFGAPTRYGIATSGTSVHRWGTGEAARHHLIDPRTGRPALTDIVQATVLARSAREAEAWAKAAVIAGSATALALLDRPSIDGAVLLTERDDLLILPSTLRYMP